MRKPLLVAALIQFAMACAGASPESNHPAQTMIVVTYVGGVETAREEVITAFERANVGEACGLVGTNCSSIRTGYDRTLVRGTTKQGGRVGHIRAELMFRDVPGETVIIISGFHRSEGTVAGVPGPEEAITSSCTSTCAAFWDRMLRIAQALRTDQDG